MLHSEWCINGKTRERLEHTCLAMPAAPLPEPAPNGTGGVPFGEPTIRTAHCCQKSRQRSRATEGPRINRHRN